MMLPRVLSMDDRIKGSCLFPRIRDAERDMIKNEEEFRRKRERLKKHRDKQKNHDHKKEAPLGANGKKIPIVQETHYFTEFIINSDPSASKYMPFDAVIFPKLFNKISAQAPPEAIDHLWMLGFEDHIQRNSKQTAGRTKDGPGSPATGDNQDNGTILTVLTADTGRDTGTVGSESTYSLALINSPEAKSGVSKGQLTSASNKNGKKEQKRHSFEKIYSQRPLVI
jgi:hypothetical protein